MSTVSRDFQVLLVSGYARRIIKHPIISQILHTCIMFYNGNGFHVEINPSAFSCDEDTVEHNCHPMSWSNSDGSTFHVRRGPNYVPGKKAKSKPALYTIFKIEGYKTPQKMHQIWNYVHSDLHTQFESEISQYCVKPNNGQLSNKYRLPPLLIINVMLPWYKPEMSKNGKKNGRGYSVVLYCHLSTAIHQKLHTFINGKSVKKKPLSPAVKLMSKFIASHQLQHERFKVMARIMNGKYSKFGFLAQKLINKYNAKPFLARQSTTYYYDRLDTYFGIDVDVHEFGFPARKGLDLVKDSAAPAIYDVGLVIEGKTNQELPEQMLLCFRMSKLPFPTLCETEISQDIIGKYKSDYGL